MYVFSDGSVVDTLREAVQRNCFLQDACRHCVLWCQEEFLCNDVDRDAVSNRTIIRALKLTQKES